MGCDGGTIPKRDELVKTKKKPEQKDKVADLAFKWRHCAISQEGLVKPIMACELGRLYNKTSILEFLIDRTKFECAPRYRYLRGLKDLRVLQLTENPAAKEVNCAEKGDGYIDMQVADYICPVAGIEMNGKYKFCFLWTCGCVFSERALKEIRTQTCHKCGQFFTERDVVVINGGEEDLQRNSDDMHYRRTMDRMMKKAKKSEKRKAAAATITSEDGATSSKQSRPESSASTSSSSGESSASTRLTNGGMTQPSSKLTSGSSADTKVVNGIKGASKLTPGDSKGTKTFKSIQEDPKASTVYKSLFNTCEQAKRQTQGHWVTYNPQYF